MVTIADLLTQPNPEFEEAQPVYKASGRTRKSTSRKHIWPLPRIVKKWRDFNVDDLDRAFNGSIREILQKDLKLDVHSELLNLGPQCFNYEESLRSVLDITHRAIVNRALNESSNDVVKQGLRMLRGDSARLYLLTLPGAIRSWPDWAVRSTEQGNYCVLPGETKTSWNWTSADLSKCVDKYGVVVAETKGALWPLRQLAYYCMLSFSRYGFLATDKELVVIRISSGRHPDLAKDKILEWKDHVVKDMTVEYESIPWNHSSGEARIMTMNLALWFLHLLAGNNGQLSATPHTSVGDEELIGPEQRIQFDALPIDNQNESQSFEASPEIGELLGMTDIVMADSDCPPRLGGGKAVRFAPLPTQRDEKGAVRATTPNAEGSRTRRVNGRAARNEVRSVLSPRNSNTRIQK